MPVQSAALIMLNPLCLAVSVLTLVPVMLIAQTQSSPPSQQQANQPGKGVDYLLNYLNMAGTLTASEFRPQTQRERTNDYVKAMTNPFGLIEAGFSAGVDQWNDKPAEWEQGASGYGKRLANIWAQYCIQRTTTFGLASLLDEDNRYFNSGRKGIWTRTSYALMSGILARTSDGSRRVSTSQLGGVAAGALLSRAWQPPSQHSFGDGAISFGLTMAGNMGIGVVKEFLPDVIRRITQKRSMN